MSSGRPKVSAAKPKGAYLRVVEERPGRFVVIPKGGGMDLEIACSRYSINGAPLPAHRSHAEALKEANSIAFHYDLAVVDEVEPAPAPAKAPASRPKAIARKQAPTTPNNAAKRSAKPFKGDRAKWLPNIDAYFPDEDASEVIERAFAEFTEARDSFKDGLASEDRICSYTQHTHYLFNFLLKHLFARVEMKAASTAAYLNAAFERIEKLEKQVAKAVPGMTYQGVWEQRTYSAGDVTTHGGNMWHCNRETAGKPGEDHGAWTLCVRKGRDGKDAR